MTVLSRAKEFGFEFWFLKAKKKPPEGGLSVQNGLSIHTNQILVLYVAIFKRRV